MSQPVRPDPNQQRQTPSRSAVFLDKDGTLVENVPYNVDPAKLRFTPQAIEGLKLLVDHGYVLFIVTNQSGLARGLFTRADFARLQAALTGLLLDQGIPIQDVYLCPHAPPTNKLEPGCLCRKPAPGMLRQAASAHHIDLPSSWMIGDILDDVEAGHRAGCRSVLMDVGNETEWRMSPLREPCIKAKTLLEAAEAILAAEPVTPPGEAEDSIGKSVVFKTVPPQPHLLGLSF
ncbi:D-glycero-alpha-D-manno-heptose-1,7-bisphosphate 7-phosphatase [Aquabacterium sp.]|uniref:D-glycero-alpha-D-manno-heptose-1,7-bisphosphate 7-phosphatase n=1 Tax=Aquabacterium sp. TaxID=1872578 RepID=UPI003D6CA43D